MKSFKILVVDDNINNIKSIVNYLLESNETYDILQALNGELAYKIAVSELPDLVITDWEMPGMNGIELIEKLKQNEFISEIPIIMCTGVMIDSENLHTALGSGAVDYIRKPIDKIELLARVKSMLEISESKKIIKERLEEIESKNKFITALIESVPHPFVYYNLDGVMTGCNSRFEKVIGISSTEIVGENFYKFMETPSSNTHMRHDSQLKCGLKDLSYECKLFSRDYVFSKSVFCSKAGKPEGIMCVLTDISELKEAHNQILETKKRELASSALRLIQISEYNNNLISDITKISEFTDQKGNEMIRKAISKFNSNAGENFWHEFESRFESVYESFYTKLNQLYPDLSTGEKKLCALLRLNLSSKDIASITFQNPQSVDMARYRLRKKMNLKQDENLVDVLMSIA